MWVKSKWGLKKNCFFIWAIVQWMMSHEKGHGRTFIILDRLLLVIIYPWTNIIDWSHIHTLISKHALLIIQSGCSINGELDLSLDWLIAHTFLAQCKVCPCPSRRIWALFNPQVIHSIWWLPVWQQQYKLWLLDVKPFQSWKNAWKCFSISSKTARTLNTHFDRFDKCLFILLVTLWKAPQGHWLRGYR